MWRRTDGGAGLMATVGRDIKDLELTERELWEDGPPHEAFKRMREECPIHWTESFEMFPEEAGFWSVTTWDDIHAVSRDWETYSSEEGGVILAAGGFPIELARAMFIGMDPPKHDRLEGALPGGFHAAADRRSRAAHPPDHARCARPSGGSRARRPGQRRGPAGGRAGDRQLHGDLRGGRRDLGETHELGAGGDGPGPQSRGRRGRRREGCAGDLRALSAVDRGAS